MRYKKSRYKQWLKRNLAELDKLLKENDLKRKWLADQLGVHRNQVYRWIKGTNEPSIENYEKIKKITKFLKKIKLNLAE